MLQEVDQIRQSVAPSLEASRKAALGQFMTPAPIASFMASLFENRSLSTSRLLDAGAGVGSLTAAFLDRWARGEFGFQRVEATVYEIDDEMRGHLEQTLDAYAAKLPVTPRVYSEDFISHGAEEYLAGRGRFTHAILNPPYKKINTWSDHRWGLSRAGIETVNLYSGFVALALGLVEQGGELVAIIPRSFCNGPYYKPFREFILAHAAIRHMHLFESRSQAFKDDAVLQENVIIVLKKGEWQGKVTVSTSTDSTFSDYAELSHRFEQIVIPGDRELFIHVPTSDAQGPLDRLRGLCHTLDEIGVKVSTGPVVDFRVSDHLRDMPEEGSVPLLYPAHFTTKGLQWPIEGLKKPNAIRLNGETRKWLYANGFYTIVRRFSSKEERRRVVAGVLDPAVFPEAEALGIENHLNVFHSNKHGLPEEMARGLAAYLNSTAVDEHFRRFSGHTQVNVTDLKQLPYPSREVLLTLGRWARDQQRPSQKQIDDQLERLTQ